MGFIFDVDTYPCQWRIIERAESIEILRIDFGGTVAPHQLVLEEDAHFGDDRGTVRMLGGGYFNGGDEVLFPVGAQGADGKLGTGEDDRLLKVLEHETEGGGCIGHGVGTVQDDEAVVTIVVVMNNAYQLPPHIRFHVRRIHRRIKLIGVNWKIELLQFGDILLQLLEVKVLQSTCRGILNHTNCSTGVY